MTRHRDPASTAATVWRMESAKLVAVGLRMVHDLSAAEDLAQDALVAALEQWPRDGVPSNPAAWLTAVVKRRAVDRARRAERLRRREPELARRAAERSIAVDEVDPDRIEDDLLRLVFIACHPAISQQARVALTLRLVGGLTTPEIARAFLVPEATVAQRIVRAKRDLHRAGAEVEEPDPQERLERLPAVLETVYLIFNEGYNATAGADWTRPELCDAAVRLARLLRGLLPEHPEVLGLLALVELQSSRLAARRDANGNPVLLEDQDRSRWDHDRIRRGLAALAAAERTGAPMGSYLLQAQIAACHARAHRAADTDWTRIADWYALLAEVLPSPVVELNRAVAVSRSVGPLAGLAVLDAIADDPRMANSHLYAAVRSELLTRAGRPAEGRAELTRAIALTSNRADRDLLQARLAALDSTDPLPG